ncbi:MAG: hypothetical protein ACTHPO_12040 [Alphaproteobacteria bacterium]
MSIKNLNQESSYEWIGTFWFPDKREDIFSGKISYSPDQGIKLSLSTPNAVKSHEDGFLSKKIMHAVVAGEDHAHITLINVWLSPNVTLGNPTISVLKGGAELLVADSWLENVSFNKMAFEYDDYFNNVFLLSVNKESDALRFSKSKPINLSSECTLDLDLFSSGTTMYSAEDLDTVFWSFEEEKLEQLKKVAKPIIEDGCYSIHRRRENNFVVTLFDGSKGFDSLKEKERIWREFWELIVDHRILIKYVWVYTPIPHDGDKVTYLRRPALYSYYRSQGEGGKAPILQNYPINIYSFAEKASGLEVVENTINKWFELSQDKKFKPVMCGIRRALDSVHEMVDTTQFVSLISEIETFLDITGQMKTDIDNLIELYASEDWKESFFKIANNKSDKETLGKWSQGIRNSIVHPKACQKIAKGKYWEVASDPFHLQKIYAYLSGLYVKAVLLYLGGINTDHIEQYILRFIEVRASYTPIEYG